MALESLPSPFCGTAAPSPGAGSLYYAPIDEVDTAAFDENAVQASDWNLQADAGVATWYTIPYAAQSGSWSEDQQDNPQGPYYRLQLSAFYPSDDADARRIFNAMRTRRFLVKVTNGGSTSIIGTVERPLRFSSAFDSGAGGESQRGHRITFSGVTLSKTPGYIPVF